MVEAFFEAVGSAIDGARSIAERGWELAQTAFKGISKPVLFALAGTLWVIKNRAFTPQGAAMKAILNPALKGLQKTQEPGKGAQTQAGGAAPH